MKKVYRKNANGFYICMVSCILLFAIVIFVTYLSSEDFPTLILPFYLFLVAITVSLRKDQNYLLIDGNKLTVVNKNYPKRNRDFDLTEISSINIKNIFCKGFYLEVESKSQIKSFNLAMVSKKDIQLIKKDLESKGIKVILAK